jgi:hypothetical protein
VDIVEATRRYESWMASRCEVVTADLDAKHAAMASSPFVFLRGTFYRFIEVWPELFAELRDAPRVLAVGDLHIENFGTWRDSEGRLVWGVNDVDEAAPLPYCVDLVRLSVSARLAITEKGLDITPRAACDALVAGYRDSLTRGGRALVLVEHDRWLRRIATTKLRQPTRFWRRTENIPGEQPVDPQARHVLERVMPRSDQEYEVGPRRAGVGSLGRPRYIAVGVSHGSHVARECKWMLPSAATLAGVPSRAGAPGTGLRLLERAVRAADPMVTAVDAWLTRRLAPDCARIEFTDLPSSLDEERLLRAMGWETANLHLGTPPAKEVVLADLDRRPRDWLLDASKRGERATRRDWSAWRRADRAGRKDAG